MGRRIILIVTCCIVWCSLWVIPAPFHVIASTNSVDTTTLTLVAPDTAPQVSDLQSRDLAMVVAPQPFSGIVVKWHVVGAINDIGVSLRTRTNGQWSNWIALSANDEFSADDDPANLVASTMISYDTAADAWQLHLEMPLETKSYVDYLRIITFNSNPSISTRMILPNAALSPLNGSKPPTVPRTVWGTDKNGNNTVAAWDARGDACANTLNACPADATWMPTASEISRPTHVVIHHTATPNDPLTSDWAARVRNIWQYHTMTNGWGDIGYHYLIDPNGVIYEGRYNGVRVTEGTVIDGAHVRGYNRSTIGISMMGTYSTVAPTPAAQNALKSLLAWLMTSYEIAPDTVSHYDYKNIDLNTIVGHRDVGQTTCPGNVLYSMLPALRNSMAGIINALWIDTVRATANTIYAGDSAEFTVKIRNQYNSASISGSSFSFIQPDTGYTYKQDECWAKRDDSNAILFDKPPLTTDANGRFRIMAGMANWDSQYANVTVKCPVTSTLNHPWRWSIGTTPLAPGASREIVGRIQFDTVGTYTIYFGMVKDWVGYPDQSCAPATNSGVCGLRPMTINVVVRPTATPTIPANALTRISKSTAVILTYQATQQTAQAFAKTAQAATATAVTASSVVDRMTATAERALGSPTRTATSTVTMTPSPTSVPILQTVSAFREETRIVNTNNTATAIVLRNTNATNTSMQKTAIVQTRIANLTATMVKRLSIQASIVAATVSKVAYATAQKGLIITATARQKSLNETQVADRRTATAEVAAQSPTRTATASITASSTRSVTSTRTITSTRSHTPTRSQTATRTSTTTRTLSPTQTSTATHVPVLNQSDIISQTVSGDIRQLVITNTRIFAVTKQNPVLHCADSMTLALTCAVPLDGVQTYLMQKNSLDANQLIVVGQLSWNTLFVQRFDIAQTPPVETGYWTLASTALPTAMLVNGRFITIALSESIPGSNQSRAELFTLVNTPALLYPLGQRLQLPGVATQIESSDTSEFGMIVTGRTATNAGYVHVVRIAGGRYTASPVTSVAKPILQFFAEPTVINLVPFTIIYANDGTTVARYLLNLSTQTVTRQSIQNLAARHIALLQSPRQLLAISNTAPWLATIYSMAYAPFVPRGTTPLGMAEPSVLVTENGVLVWAQAQAIYRASIVR